MYKVLIVDDEILVRIGLKNTIDWEHIGFTVIGEAANGEQGYAQFLELTPDVVITDIRMPKKDGLWLTEKIHKESKHTKILVLTCYDEFKYAQTALKNGATDYILKSEIVDDELVALMRTLKNDLDEQKQTQSTVEETPYNKSALQRALLNDLIKMKCHIDPKLKARFEAQGFPLDTARYAFVYFKNTSGDTTGKRSQKQVSEAILNLVTSRLEETGIQYIFNGYVDEHWMLLASSTLSLTALHRIGESVQKAVTQYFDSALQWIFTDVFESTEDMGVVYECLRQHAEYLFYVPRDHSCVVNIGALTLNAVDTQELKKQYTSAFIDAIGREDLEGAGRALSTIIEQFRTHHHPPQTLKLFITQLLGEIYTVFQYVFDTPEVTFSYNGFYASILKTSHVDELEILIFELFKSIIQELGYIRDHQSRYVIKRAENFIEHNYTQSLSLEDIAKVLNLSKQYVCSLFKKETGQNLSTYINTMRIEKAKQLLLSPGYRTKDVYTMVGYANQQYFTRVFKKMTGMPPSEWQKRHTQGIKNKHRGVEE